MHYFTLDTSTFISFWNHGLAGNSLFRVTWFVNGWLEFEVRQSVPGSQGLHHWALLPHPHFSTVEIFKKFLRLAFCCLVAKLCLSLLWPHGLAPLSMGFPRQEYWSGLPFPSPGISPTYGLNLRLLYWHVDSSPLSNLPFEFCLKMQSWFWQMDTIYVM